MRYQKINSQNFAWYDLVNPERADFNEFVKKFNFHPLNIEDCFVASQRSKLEQFDNYIFASIRLPFFQRQKRQFQIQEIRVFVGRDFLITIHSGYLPEFISFIKNIKTEGKARENFLRSPQYLFYSILNHLVTAYFPMLDHLGEDIDKIEENIFKGQEKLMVKEISIILRNLLDLRKTIKPLLGFSEKLLGIDHSFFSAELKIYLRDLNNEVKQVWTALENHYQVLKTLQSTNNSLISHNLSDRIKTLTVISVLLLPLSLIAGFFGVNMENVEFVFGSANLWLLFILMAIVTLGVYFYFKFKKFL
ncbi:MAG: hypothetical protein ACD_68C00026G0004 [uncultured bacterium]|nr:MAG: hypothetical protein ACD_68C00026G0004 [uncultured bacterium]